MKPVHIVIIVAVLIISAAAWFFYQKKKKETELLPENNDKKDKSNIFKGDAKILAMQKQLNSLLPAGFPKLIEDGIWGAKTQEVLNAVAKTGKLPAEMLYLLKDIEVSKTYTDAEYKQFADEIFAAISGVNNIYRVQAVLRKLKTPTDWQKTIKAFGIRKSKINSFESGLIGWLNDDLSTSELKGLELILNAFGATLKM